MFVALVKLEIDIIHSSSKEQRGTVQFLTEAVVNLQFLDKKGKKIPLITI